MSDRSDFRQLWRHGAVAASAIALTACGVNNDKNLLNAFPEYGVRIQGAARPIPTLAQAQEALTPDSGSRRSADYVFNSAVGGFQTGEPGARVLRESRRAGFSFSRRSAGVGALRLALEDSLLIADDASLPSSPSQEASDPAVIIALDAARDSYNALSLPNLTAARTFNAAASQAPDDESNAVRGGGYLESARVYSTFGLWAAQYGEGNSAQRNDGYVYGVYAYGLPTPADADMPITGNATYSGGTLGYLVPLGAVDAREDEFYLLSGTAVASVAFAAEDEGTVTLTLNNMRSVAQSAAATAWHDVKFTAVPLDGNRYRAFSILETGTDAAVAVTGTVEGTLGITDAQTPEGFVDGWFYGRPDVVAGPEETAGTWGIETDTLRARGAFGAPRDAP